MFKKIYQSFRKWWRNKGKTFEPPKEQPKKTVAEYQANIPYVGANELWYPKAVKGSGMKVQGKYAKGYPRGAVVHFTAGHCETETDAKNTLQYSINQGFAFFLIGPTGVVYQNFPLSHWGSHAGSSSYPGLSSSLSKHLVGIEVVCAGNVDAKGKSWFGKTYSKERLRAATAKDNVKAGLYVKFTDAQEKALKELLIWLYRNNPEVFEIQYIVGHDEIAPSRKSDPGMSLSMTMPQLRQVIKDLTNA